MGVASTPYLEQLDDSEGLAYGAVLSSIVKGRVPH